MKKLYIAAATALLAIGSASADNLTFYIGEKAVTNGEKVVFPNYEWDDYGDGMGSFTIDPDASLVSTNGGSVIIIAESLEGPDIQLCAGGMCEAGKKVTKNVNMTAGEKLPLFFDVMGFVEEGGENAVPEILARLSAAGGGEEVSFTILMGKLAGVQNIFVDDAAFMLTRNGISYNVGGVTVASLYDMSGNRVMTTTINGQGTLSTAGIPAGVYVYQLNGAVNRSGMMYVK